MTDEPKREKSAIHPATAAGLAFIAVALFALMAAGRPSPGFALFLLIGLLLVAVGLWKRGIR